MAILSCFNILTSFSILMIVLPSQLEAYYTTNTGCHHNGTWYADKSLVPTTEKCLNCQCNKKTLVCRLKVCPEMPMPPPRGCVVVQKKNTCCPYLSCARLDAFYKIPATRRIIAYLDHYERESIDRVVNENMLQRRSDDSDVDLYVCVKNGTVYKSGSAMSSSNLCSYCYCIGGTEKCVKPKCMLPVEGCKPIFVDSTCCPVRYDCSTKQTGKSSQEVRYRKTSNKHYMRMSQRLQRNHGCTVGQQFYTEGQKMKSDKDKPCDICFCIRGQRKCAPKKCAPSLRNCIPVVPKGQCCPSSYDCGSQRDYRRSQNSRQFNLFSLLFGKDEENYENSDVEMSVQYPHDRDPVSPKPAKFKDSTTEKSFYDTLREGLEFIDNNNNNNQMLKDNMDLEDMPVKKLQFKQTRPSPTPIPLSMHNIFSTTTEVSFLDFLLGSSEAGEKKHESSSEEMDAIEDKTTPINTGIHWVDFLLGPDEDDVKNVGSAIADKIDNNDTTNTLDRMDFESTTSIDRLDHDALLNSGENYGVLNADQQEKLVESTTDSTSITDPDAVASEETTDTYITTLTLETTEQPKYTQSINKELLKTTEKPVTTTTTTTKRATTISTTKSPSTTTTTTTQIKATHSSEKSKPPPTKRLQNLHRNQTQSKPEHNSDFLAQLLGGLSDILERENITRTNTKPTGSSNPNTNKISNAKLPTAKPIMPLFKPLPQNKTHTRINSKIANLTVRPPIISTKDLTKLTLKPLTLSEATVSSQANKEELKITTGSLIHTMTTTTNKPTVNTRTVTITSTSTAPTATATTTSFTTLKPVVIKTNPTILESEPLDQNTEPTLPPSLPNLKIIPFLPTDAVKADQSSSYEFYHHSSVPISRIDYDLYDDANLYPSITEKYPLYPDLEDGSKAEYIYKFNVEGPDSLVSSNAGKFDGTLGAPAFLKYDFPGTGTPSSIKGFSPPSKTEGGFLPKEPLILDDGDDHDSVGVKVSDSYHVTQHIIDITTSGNVVNTTKVIEITTPDPFKDVIRTEPPPDLISLIEDKLKNLISKSNTTMKSSTASSQVNGQPQNATDIKMHLKQTDTKPMTLKTTTQIKMTAATHIGNNNEINRPQAEVEMENPEQQRITQVVGDDVFDETNFDVNYVSTIPPFKSMPTSQQWLQDYTSTVTKEFAKSQTNNELKHTDTTTRPMGSSATTMPTNKLAAIATTKRQTAEGTIKVNRNTTNVVNAIIKQIRPQQQHQQQQQMPAKINKNFTLNGSEINELAASETTTAKIATSASSSSFSSSSPSSSSVDSVSTVKSKSNATRRITSTKPTKRHKPASNTILQTDTINSTTKPNAINIDRTSLTTRRTQKPTSSANMMMALTKSKTATSAIATTTTTTTTTTSKPTTAIRTTTSLPSSTSSSPLPSPSPLSSSSSSSLLLQRVPATNPYFMSPFDKLPFMDASFEVKRISATPPTTTTTTAAPTSTKQRFAVAATISTEALIDGASDEQDAASRQKLMGLVHYKHTLNQLEGLEPSTQYRPQSTGTSYHHQHHINTQFSSRVSSPSTASQQQQHQHSSSLNNLIDPTGILKLAGCNIYGRMYRVGRIIVELSSPCLECKCTEIGVKCGPLEC